MSAGVEQLDNVSVKLKANVYFEGGVVSHTVLSAGGKKQTIGLIRPGSYHFTTDAPERMDIIGGVCRVKLTGDNDWKTYHAGEFFNVPGKSAFDIAVESGLAEYLCSFN